MLKPQLTHQSSQYSTQTPFLQLKPFIHGNGNASLPISRHSFQKKNKSVRVGFTPSSIKAVASSTEKSTSVKAIVTVKLTVGGFLSNLGLARGIDDIKDLLGQTLQLELVSSELDPSKLLIQQNYTPNNLTNQTSFTTLFKVYFNLPNADYESRMHASYLYIFCYYILIIS